MSCPTSSIELTLAVDSTATTQTALLPLAAADDNNIAARYNNTTGVGRMEPAQPHMSRGCAAQKVKCGTAFVPESTHLSARALRTNDNGVLRRQHYCKDVCGGTGCQP